MRCTDATRHKNDPKCASELEIDEWLKYKKLSYTVIDQGADFLDTDHNIRETEVFLHTLTLKKGVFTD